MSKQTDLLNLTDAITANGLGNAAVVGSLAVGSNFTQNSQQSISGGGDISWSGTYLKWSERFLAVANGRSATTATSGYFDIETPAAGTVITGLGSTPDVTCVDGIPMGPWQSLWYILPLGSSEVSVPANFRIAEYSSMLDVIIPSHWILIATTNADNGGRHVKTCAGRNVVEGSVSYPDTGLITPTLLNGWVGYGSDYSPVYYSRKNNVVTLIGLVKDGTSGTIFNLPVGFRPAARLLTSTLTNSNALARLDVRLDGDVLAAGTYNASWFSVACSFTVS
jgi:hypothetical protein